MQGGCWQLANIARFCHVVASTAHFGRQTFLPLPSSPISYFFSCASVCRVRLMPTTMNFQMNYHFRHSIVDVVYVTLICQIYVHLKTTRWRTFKLDANDSTINLISTKNGIKSSWSINCKCKLLRRMHTMHIAHIFSLPKKCNGNKWQTHLSWRIEQHNRRAAPTPTFAQSAVYTTESNLKYCRVIRIHFSFNDEWSATLLFHPIRRCFMCSLYLSLSLCSFHFFVGFVVRLLIYFHLCWSYFNMVRLFAFPTS